MNNASRTRQSHQAMSMLNDQFVLNKNFDFEQNTIHFTARIVDKMKKEIQFLFHDFYTNNTIAQF